MSKWKDVLRENLWDNNPVFIQVLGICSTLAVTNKVENTLIMTAAVVGVTALSNFTISIIKNLIPRKVRMIVQTLVIAFFVIIVDIILKAQFPVISKALGPYVGLVITNCIIMGRAEAFAQSNPPLISFWDGLTSGLGYMSVLVVIAVFRELLGFGTIMGAAVMPQGFIPMTIMIMAPSGFFMLAILIWIIRGRMLKQEAKS